MTIAEVKKLPVYKEIRKQLFDFFHYAEEVDEWLRMENPLLGGITPLQMIGYGRGERLLKFIESQTSEND